MNGLYEGTHKNIHYSLNIFIVSFTSTITLTKGMWPIVTQPHTEQLI